MAGNYECSIGLPTMKNSDTNDAVDVNEGVELCSSGEYIILRVSGLVAMLRSRWFDIQHQNLAKNLDTKVGR